MRSSHSCSASFDSFVFACHLIQAYGLNLVAMDIQSRLCHVVYGSGSGSDYGVCS
jgi:hypothetical protein